MISKPFNSFLFFSFLILQVSCTPIEDSSGKSVLITGDYQYQIHNPDKTYTMPKKLVEISGIKNLGDSVIGCVQDEKGKLYLYNTTHELITREIKFNGKGDYEGVAIIDTTVYVVRSNGRIYHFPVFADSPYEADYFDTPFSSSNDIEGLSAFNDSTLLIACKGNAEVNENGIKGRAVYKYDTKNEKLDPTPFIHMKSNEFEKKLEEFDLKPMKHMPFGPSGIAIHPITNDIFLIGSVGRLIIVFDKSGKIKDMGTLKSSLFKQPEGICFDSKGNLYISSEGKSSDGYILKFNYRKTNK